MSYSPLNSYLAFSSKATSPPKLSKPMMFGTSGLGGCMGWILIHPANTVAVRMSLANMQGKPFSFSKMVAENGWSSLYDGISAGLLRQIVYATSRFGLFETLRDYLQAQLGEINFITRVAAGAVTGGTAAIISCPMEVATVRMSNDKTLPESERRNYKGIADTATRILREEGISAFWHGVGPFATRAVMVGIFQVATLDQFKETYAQLLGQKKNSIPNVFYAAMTSGLIYSVATMPLEASKNRMASQKPDPVTKELPYRSTLQTLRKVTVEEGFVALYNGFLPYYVRCGGHTVAMFIFVQMLRDMISSK